MSKTNTIFTIYGTSEIKLKSSERLSRTFGWHETLERAKEVVEADGICIHEYAYDYVAIEEFPPGIFPVCINEWWYRWNSKDEKYMSINKPKILKQIINFGLG